MKSIFLLIGIALIILTVSSVEISAHRNEGHDAHCVDCNEPESEYSFVGEQNEGNKYHQEDKNHGHNKNTRQNHGHAHHHQDFIENHGHGHHNRGHGHH